jgi:four helix bundle protein
MKKVKRFEDFLAWEKAMDMAVAIYEASRKRPFALDFSFCVQIQKAAVSVPSNIAEGFERGSRPEFHRFLCIAKASAAEVRTQLMLAKRLGYLHADEFTRLMKEAERVSQLVGKLRATVAKQRSEPLPTHAASRMPHADS